MVSKFKGLQVFSANILRSNRYGVCEARITPIRNL